MTKLSDVVDNYFGVEVADPYRWLENVDDPAVREWIEEQNRRTRSRLDAIACRDELADRLRTLWNYPRATAPFCRGGRYFWSENDGLQNQNVYYMGNMPFADGVPVLDVNTLAADGVVALSVLSVSSCGRYIGYGISKCGSDWCELHVRDSKTLADYPDVIEWVKFSDMAWHADGFFYSSYPPPSKADLYTGENMGSAVFYHRMGDDQSADTLIFADKHNAHRGYDVMVTSDGAYLVITVTESTSGNGIYVKSLANADAPVAKLIDDYRYDFFPLGHSDGKLFFMTNHDAPNYRIASLDMQTNALATVIGESADGDVMEHASYSKGRFCVEYLHDAYSKVVIYDINTEAQYEVLLPGMGTVSHIDMTDADDKFCFSYSSFLTPPQIYSYDIRRNALQLLRETTVQFDFSAYEVSQHFCTSADGTRIPMFIVGSRNMSHDGTGKAWLYGYGGFNISLTPAFDIKRLYWLERGGTYVVVNLRGGGEYGEAWHKAGTLLEKKNVFDDFIAAARYLIDEGFTTPERLVCQGGSNGGLLIGAVINKSPELFRVALPAVGVMDMLRYHKFTIGRYWATDYGTAEDSKTMFEYLYSYSPLHNISERNYPSVLITTADHDDRVVPAHSFKYAATMQERYSGKRPILIRIESSAGHGAGKPVSKLIEEMTDIYSFVFDEIEPVR